MSDFWAGYLLARGSDDGPAIPPWLAVLFFAFLGFIALLYLLQDLYQAIASITRSRPLLSIIVVGIVGVLLSKLTGASSDIDVQSKLTGAGIVGMGLVASSVGISMVVGSGPEGDSGPVEILFGLVALVGLLLLLYMCKTLIQYRCTSSLGRAIRTLSIVLLVCWMWIAGFGLPLPAIPLAHPDTFLFTGLGAAIAVGVIETEDQLLNLQ